MIYIILLLKNRDEKETLENQYENDYNFSDFIIPNHKPRGTILR